MTKANELKLMKLFEKVIYFNQFYCKEFLINCAVLGL